MTTYNIYVRVTEKMETDTVDRFENYTNSLDIPNNEEILYKDWFLFIKEYCIINEGNFCGIILSVRERQIVIWRGEWKNMIPRIW